MSLTDSLQSLHMLITYVYSTEATPAELPLKLIFTGDA